MEIKHPLAGCDCFLCEQFRMLGHQEWIIPEIESGPEIIIKYPKGYEAWLKGRDSKTMAALKRKRVEDRILTAEIREFEKKRKYRIYMVLVVMIIVITYFGSGILIWNN